MKNNDSKIKIKDTSIVYIALHDNHFSQEKREIIKGKGYYPLLLRQYKGRYYLTYSFFDCKFLAIEREIFTQPNPIYLYIPEEIKDFIEDLDDYKVNSNTLKYYDKVIHYDFFPLSALKNDEFDFVKAKISPFQLIFQNSIPIEWEADKRLRTRFSFRNSPILVCQPEKKLSETWVEIHKIHLMDSDSTKPYIEIEPQTLQLNLPQEWKSTSQEKSKGKGDSIGFIKDDLIIKTLNRYKNREHPLSLKCPVCSKKHEFEKPFLCKQKSNEEEEEDFLSFRTTSASLLFLDRSNPELSSLYVFKKTKSGLEGYEYREKKSDCPLPLWRHHYLWNEPPQIIIYKEKEGWKSVPLEKLAPSLFYGDINDEEIFILDYNYKYFKNAEKD